MISGEWAENASIRAAAYKCEEIIQETANEIHIVEVLAGVAEGRDEQVAQTGLIQLVASF